MFYESDIEKTIIDLLVDKGYSYLDDNSNWIVERQLSDFINEDTLLQQLVLINKGVKNKILEEAIRTIKNIDHPSLFERNKIFHQYLVNGITIEDYESDVNPLIKLIDFENIDNNKFEVGNQIKFKEFSSRSTRIPDVIIFINGLPLIVMELKSFQGFEGKLLEDAYDQLGGNTESSGYRYDIPSLFNYNAFNIISDGVNSKVGVLTSKIDRYNEWKSVNGELGFKDNYAFKLNVLVNGLLEPRRLIDVIKNNIFFINKDKSKNIKIMSQYHQYFGVCKSVEKVKNALKPHGDGKAGLLWHTQGSGKSFTMVMLAHRLITDKSLGNPTIIVLTDRNDLDEQLFNTFSSASEYLRCTPIKVNSRKDLLEKLKTIKQGGVIFSTIQKFEKDEIQINDRSNIIVMADEAHRGHYGLYEKISYQENEETKELEFISKYGTEKYIRDSLPNATFIGFTGTPVTTADKSTTDIYGDIIDTYDMTQSVIDGATVRIFYEGRLAKVWTDQSLLRKIDDYYNELENKGVSDTIIEESKKKMSNIKVILEDDDLISMLAQDIVIHYEQRKSFLNGKAMIVMPTRIAAAKLYNKIIELRPSYQDILVAIVTESNKDTKEMRDLFKSKIDRQKAASEFKSENSKIKIAIVVDMWLTGFDVPDLDVMYVFKKMKAHNLMQAIARVNRVYPGKESGLIVDYIGLAKALEEALSTYTARDHEFNLKDVQEVALTILKEKLSIFNEWFYKIDKDKFNSPISKERFEVIQQGAAFILESDNRKKEFLKLSLDLKHAYIVSAGILDKEQHSIVQYYLSVRNYILKLEIGIGPIGIGNINDEIEKLVADAIKGDEVKVLTKVGTSDQTTLVDLLRPEKIEELKKANPPHVFLKIIENLLKQVIAESRKTNLYKAQQYSERLRRILEKYHNREGDFDTTDTIIKIIDFAQEVVSDEDHANDLGLSGRERAFYDALAGNKSAYELLTDETLKCIAHELKEVVEEYSTTDWSKKKATQAKMRREIKRLLRKYNYPPEYTEDAIQTVIKQAEYMM
ncbi:MAG: type I restriction endonuclease subunit R [Bacilli bacterium]